MKWIDAAVQVATLKPRLIAGAVGALVVVLFVLIMGVAVGGAVSSSATANQCGGGVVDAQPASAGKLPGTGAGGSWSPAQVANILTVIGVAKEMFPGQAEQAAVIGLMVASTESGFRNLANDNTSYPGLSYSLTLANDGTGHDHSSVGIMQQQAVYSWGAVGASTWAADPQGVIRRLMTPTFAVGKFYAVMAAVPGWASADPATVAQTVQVSGPNAYATAKTTAQQLWGTYGATAATVPPSPLVGWSGTPGAGTAVIDVSCQGGGAITGDKKQVAAWILGSGKVTLQGAPGDRSNAYEQMQMTAKGVPGCNLNLGVLQLIVTAANTLGHISVSSLNRNDLCTGKPTTTFDDSYHSIDGGGHAVDFVGGGIDGYDDAPTVALLTALRPVLPARVAGDKYFTWIGQLDCRKHTLGWPGIYEGNDSCTHQHINISPRYNDTGLPGFTNPAPASTANG